MLISAKPANQGGVPSKEEGVSSPISRISKGLAESVGNDFPSPGQEKPEEFSRLAGLAEPYIQQPALLEDWGFPPKEVESLATILVSLGAPVLRLDVERVARGYQSIVGMSREEVAKLLRWLVEEVAKEFPEAGAIDVTAQWPGRWPEKTRNETPWSAVNYEAKASSRRP